MNIQDKKIKEKFFLEAIPMLNRGLISDMKAYKKLYLEGNFNVFPLDNALKLWNIVSTLIQESNKEAVREFVGSVKFDEISLDGVHFPQVLSPASLLMQYEEYLESVKSYDKVDTPEMLDRTTDNKEYYEYLIRKEAIEGYDEKIFFGDTISVDGKIYVSMEHIQEAKKAYLSSIGKE